MELKDMILSTLEELDVEQDISDRPTFQSGVRELTREVEVEHIDLETKAKQRQEEEKETEQKTTLPKQTASEQMPPKQPEKPVKAPIADFANEALKDENREFLLNLRERILVLFEGFQAPNNQKLENKIELTLNFFEYLLAAIDEKLENTK